MSVERTSSGRLSVTITDSPDDHEQDALTNMARAEAAAREASAKQHAGDPLAQDLANLETRVRSSRVTAETGPANVDTDVLATLRTSGGKAILPHEANLDRDLITIAGMDMSPREAVKLGLIKLDASGQIAGRTDAGQQVSPKEVEPEKEVEDHPLNTSGREFAILGQLDGDTQGAIINSVASAALSEDGSWTVDIDQVANAAGITKSDAESLLRSAQYEFTAQAKSLAVSYDADLAEVRVWASKHAKQAMHQAVVSQIVDRDMSGWRHLLVDYSTRAGEPGSE